MVVTGTSTSSVVGGLSGQDLRAPGFLASRFFTGSLQI